MLRRPLLAWIIRKMHMPVNEISGMILLQQTVKTPKSHMWQIFPIIDAKGGSVGNQYIQPPVTADLALQLHGAEKHLFLRILEISGPVFHGSSQTGDAYSLKFKDPAVNTGAAVWRRIQIAVIMIAVNI